MRREGLAKHWAVVEAYKNGATIEWSGGEGWEVTTDPAFYEGYEYRVKKEPRKLFAVYKSGKFAVSYDTKKEAERLVSFFADPSIFSIVEYTEQGV